MMHESPAQFRIADDIETPLPRSRALVVQKRKVGPTVKIVAIGLACAIASGTLVNQFNQGQMATLKAATVTQTSAAFAKGLSQGTTTATVAAKTATDLATKAADATGYARGYEAGIKQATRPTRCVTPQVSGWDIAKGWVLGSSKNAVICGPDFQGPR